MNEERMKILKMVEEGKLSIEDATKLIEAVETSQDKEILLKQPKWLRIRVAENGEDKVKVNLPISLAKIAMKFIPDNAKTQMVSKGIDLDQILAELGSVEGGKIVEVTDGGDHVEIFVE